MAAARSTSLRALSKLAAPQHAPRGARALHMTGPAEFSTVLTTDGPASATSLRAEAERLHRQHDAMESSAYHQQPLRHFNTSRALKAVGDSSTMDFAYLPELELDAPAALAALRIPLLPAGLYGGAASYAGDAAADEIDVMRPEIVTASADSTHIASPRAFREVHDNNAVDIAEMAQRVAMATGLRGGAGAAGGAPESMAKQLWQGMLDDLFGSGGSGSGSGKKAAA